MEQGRRLAALEKRLDAIDAARRADREVLGRALIRASEELSRLRRAVCALEREKVIECSESTTGSEHYAG
jgi:BMFP domain-containing protein YqiC